MIISYNGKSPLIESSVFIAPNATIIGDVVVSEQASIWYGAVLRADEDQIIIGPRSNVQDGSIIHVSPGYPTVLTEDVTVGHAVVLHGCRLEKGAVIGSGSVILDGAVVGSYALVAAGSVVRPGMIIPDRHLVTGVPAVDRGPLSEQLLNYVESGSEEYIRLASNYIAEAVISSK